MQARVKLHDYDGRIRLVSKDGAASFGLVHQFVDACRLLRHARACAADFAVG